ncbi:TPA: helix-turn-helix domain-containing protein [Escherichia coli]|uniref:helix-turn-helix domain-containing protein n=1 Tax=Escherichia coli TaxID=562 RepID=UPI00163E733D|nr:helix-turn-helix transcriptional regulator [Escherichia coli]EFD5358708.1 helix-turn-helix domain-containing protein [Escherichia coli]EJL4308143.1 helix-turn-helix domain-containing protein [Escherichia coli]EJZ9501539.1 helix-turn-helix domain-containing protein [Escherichia coli]MCO4884206.1 helix-turn-helix domain-containing protein [Escherichia coli]HAW0524836.1 helix-turn-helix domain-containing protein [Escherichia coli]
MKSIHDVRRENLKDVIDREFNGVQSRLAERMVTQPNLINRWANGKKIIGDQSARKIEKAANKPTNWLDIDRSLSIREEESKVDTGDACELAAHNLRAWMSENRELSSQQRLAEASGISQSSINRMLRNEVSITIANLDAIAAAFGRRGYELLIPPDDPGVIKYDRSRYALLPKSEKDKVESFIDFVMMQNGKNQE